MKEEIEKNKWIIEKNKWTERVKKLSNEVKRLEKSAMKKYCEADNEFDSHYYRGVVVTSDVLKRLIKEKFPEL